MNFALMTSTIVLAVFVSCRSGSTDSGDLKAPVPKSIGKIAGKERSNAIEKGDQVIFTSEIKGKISGSPGYGKLTFGEKPHILSVLHFEWRKIKGIDDNVEFTVPANLSRTDGERYFVDQVHVFPARNGFDIFLSRSQDELVVDNAEEKDSHFLLSVNWGQAIDEKASFFDGENKTDEELNVEALRRLSRSGIKVYEKL